MSVEEQKRVVLRFFDEIWNQRQRSVAAEIISPDCGDSLRACRRVASRLPVHCTATGTHTGSWLGMPPTGRQITIRMAVTYRLAGGMIAEDWVLVDFLGVFQQLGLVPPTSEILQRSRRN